MIFVSVCLAFVVISIIFFKKVGVPYPISKGIALAAGTALLAVICLAQNYTQSLIPAAHDGISISNKIAYWIIGEDGWSHDLFLERFNQSIFITGFLIFLYPVILLAESYFLRKGTEVIPD